MRASLNHVYRLVWSDVQRCFVAVSEVSRGRGKASKTTGALAVALATLLHGHAYAQLPTGGDVVGGSGSIATSGSTMTVTQTSDRMVANWQSFSIGKGNTVNFVQPSSSSVALNRVVGSDVSVIQGAINANGQVFLVNPNGVLFTKDSQVNVGGIVASTLNISTQDFMVGNYKFEGASSNAVVNHGNITAAPGGYVAMIAARIENTGSVSAQAGNVLMGAGSKVTLDLGGPVKIQVEQGAIDALIEQGGAIKADGGLVYLTASAVGDLVSTVINHTGITEAQTLATGESGQIYLMGDMRNGRIEVAGTLDASAPNGGNGGFIETSAAKVKVDDGAQVRAGEWLIDPYDFTISATGGDISGAAVGNALANGNVIIQTTNANVSCTGVTGCSMGTASGNGDIFVNDSITWSSGYTLLLSAYRNIEINAPIDASQVSGGVLGLAYGQGAPVANNTASYTINAPVSLKSGNNFATVLGSGGAQIMHTVINSQDELQRMTLDGNYALGSSLALTGKWTPIGVRVGSVCTTITCYSGKFTGLGNTISNLSTNGVVSYDKAYAGMFGAISNFGSVTNLRLSNVTVDLSLLNGVWTNAYVGGLVGDAYSALFYNISISGSVSVPNQTTDYTGGLVGNLTQSQVANSHADVVVQGGSAVGGLVGWNGTGSNINNSSARGNVTAVGKSTGNQHVGGLIGYNIATVQNTYALGNVTAIGTPGGSFFSAGGLTGYHYNSTISNSYSTGAVRNDTQKNSGFYVGGFAGAQFGTISSSFWDSDSSLQASAFGPDAYAGTVIGLKSVTSTINAFTQGTYTGFDFTNTWWMADGATRPFLRSEWRQHITNAHELQLMAMNLSADYTLANDIDLAPSLTNASEMWRDLTASGSFIKGSFVPIGYQIDDNTGAASFTGVFDGQSFTISNLHINRPSTLGLPYANQIGLFGELESAVIKNLSLTGNVTGYGEVGALAGTALGTTSISGVTSSVVVHGHSDVGGLVGRLLGSDDDNRVTISDSSSLGNVTASNAGAGGLVGDAENFTITNSSASGDVEAEYYVGGLVAGAKNGTITGSHASGDVTGTDDDEIGGLVGGASNVVIEDSYATGDVTGGYLVGGLVGVASQGTIIRNSHATGNVEGNSDVGGLVGILEGSSIVRSYATGLVSAVDGSQSVGGLVGYVDGGSVSQSYATGNVTAGSNASRVGGLLGQFYGNGVIDSATYQVTDSYATGSVTVGTSSEGIGGLIGSAEYSYVARTYAVGAVIAGIGSTDFGGLFGFNDGSVVNSFWNTETAGAGITRGVGSGAFDPEGVLGRTSAQLKNISTFTGWSIENDQTLDASNPYPRLSLTNQGPIWLIKSLNSGGNGGSQGNGNQGVETNEQETRTQNAIRNIIAQLASNRRFSDDSTVGSLQVVVHQGSLNSLLSTMAPAGGEQALSGGLSLVSVNELPSGGSVVVGQDALGFMTVFVVQGGIRTKSSDLGGATEASQL